MRPPLLFAALSAVLLSSCFSPGDGLSPPLESIYFPTGLALDTPPDANPADPNANKPDHLFIASSDFDLQYRASALASYSLEALEPLLPLQCNTDADCARRAHTVCDSLSVMPTPTANPSFTCVDPATMDPCLTLGLTVRSAADQLYYPGRCNSIAPSKANGVIADTVEIGAFATDLVYRNRPNATGDYIGRLFAPVRGDATLHWIDINQGALDCGQANSSDGGCDAHHRIGDDQDTESPNQLREEPEPFGIAIDDESINIAITNQTTGSVSLFVNHWDTAADGYPELVSIVGGLPSAPVGVAALPTPVPQPIGYETGFLVVYRDAAQVDLLRVNRSNPTDDSSSVDGTYYPRTLTRAGTTFITANSVGTDSRSIVIDNAAHAASYDACSAASCTGLTDTDDDNHPLTDCLKTCTNAAPIPNVYVANRAPASLLVGSFTPDPAYAAGSSELPAFTDSVPLLLGPSRVILGKVRVASTAPGATPDPSGSYVLEQRVFIVCFDSRKIFVYDPVRRLIEATVDTGRGPFAMAVDEARGRAYLAHFTDSYLGVISLDQRFPQSYAAIVASVGVPSQPRASK